MSESEPTVNEAAFWQGLYERQGDRWELGGPAPPLVHYLATHPRLPGQHIAVPGCGRGHDARLLARQGYRVRAFDFAEPAIREARALAAQARVEVVFEQRDVFDLATDYRGAFDGLWEYTCFCAIDPARRPEYVALVHALLKPGGWLLACFFPVGERPGGPPFATTETEVRRLFEPRFAFEETYVPATSADGRQGREWLVLARATA
jgi:SAM-dependent methyltransferase